MNKYFCTVKVSKLKSDIFYKYYSYQKSGYLITGAVLKRHLLLDFLLTSSTQRNPSRECIRFLEQKRNSAHFIETERSVPHSRVPATCPYPDPARYSPYPHIKLPEVSHLYYPPICTCASQVVSLSQISPPKFSILLPSPHKRYMPCRSNSYRFFSPEKYWMSCTDH